ncbi:MAG: hypothetical protein K0S78_2378, partial [Thermomicrobiales bacterium]|nr:hypothetical protein [Thermomicrobiales bacterium]
IEEQFGAQLARLDRLGLLIVERERVRLSHRGGLVANSVCAEFL